MQLSEKQFHKVAWSSQGNVLTTLTHTHPLLVCYHSNTPSLINELNYSTKRLAVPNYWYLNELFTGLQLFLEGINLLAVIFNRDPVLFSSLFQLCLKLFGIGFQALDLLLQLLPLSIHLLLHVSNFFTKSKVLLHQTCNTYSSSSAHLFYHYEMHKEKEKSPYKTPLVKLLLRMGDQTSAPTFCAFPTTKHWLVPN